MDDQPMNNDNLKTVAETYGELAIQKKEIEAKMKKLSAPLREALADRGATNIGKYVFSVTTNPGKRTLDKEALSQALSQHGLDINAFEKVGAPFTVMSVKEAQTL